MELEENKNYVVCVERPDIFAKFVGDLWRQQNGEEGAFILSEEEKECVIAKEIQLIVNPFDITCNSKKTIAKIYQDIVDIALAEYDEEIVSFQQRSIQLIDKLSQKVPYHLEYNLDFSMKELFKLFDLKISDETETLIEKIIDYLRIVHQVMRQRVFLFVNLKSYLADEELTQLYEFCAYEKINIILVENTFRSLNDREKGWIIDKDLCIIDLDELTAHGQCDGLERTRFGV